MTPTIEIDGRCVLTIEESATRLGCSVPTFRRLVNAGKIAPVRAAGRVWFVETEVKYLAALRAGEIVGVKVVTERDGLAGLDRILRAAERAGVTVGISGTPIFVKKRRPP